MTHRPRSPQAQRSSRRGRLGAVYVEVIVAIIPVLVFFLGLLQLAMLYISRLVVVHAAQRAVRSAVVVLEDDPKRFDGTPQGQVTYHDKSSTSAGSTQKFAQGLADVVKVQLPLADVQRLTTSESGPRLAAIQRAAYMPLATLSPPSEMLLGAFGLGDDTLGSDSATLTRFMVGFLLYNRAAAMITLRKPDGVLATCLGPTDDITVRVSYLYMCTIPVAANFMCSSLLELSGLDQLDDAAKNYYQTLKGGGLDGVQQAKDGLQRDLQHISDTTGELAGELQYAASPELLLPFLFSHLHFKIVTAEAHLQNQGANYYVREPCEKQVEE